MRRAIVFGTATGFLILGIGGRIAMRIIALMQGQSGGFSWGGSFTVMMLGAGAGAIVAAILIVSRKLFPKRRIPGGVFFWGVIAAFVARGLNPVSVLNLTVFSPLFLLHGSLLTWWWCRTHSGHGSIHASPHLQSVH